MGKVCFLTAHSNSQIFELGSSELLEDTIDKSSAKIGFLSSKCGFWTAPEAIQPKSHSRMTTPLSVIRLSNIASSSKPRL